MPKKGIASALALFAVFAASILCIQGCNSPAFENADTADSLHQEEHELEAASNLKPVIEGSGWYSVLNGVYDLPSYQYSIIVKNPNKSDISDAVLKVVGKNDEGMTVFLQEEVIPLISAGDSCMLGGSADSGTAAHTIEFSVSGGSVVNAVTPKAADMFVVEGVSETNGAEGMSYAGVISACNVLPEGYREARVNVLLRDQSGELTAGYSTVVEICSVGESIPFEISAPGAPPHSSYEVSVVPWR